MFLYVFSFDTSGKKKDNNNVYWRNKYVEYTKAIAHQW